MKKIFALMLVLCMMLSAVPVLAESPEDTPKSGSGWGEVFSGLFGGSDKKESGGSGIVDAVTGLLDGLVSEETRSGLSDAFSRFTEELKKAGKEGASALGAKLKEKIEKELKNPDSGLSALITNLASGMAKGSSPDLEALLSSLFGGSESPEGAAEADETFGETLERLNREAEAQTGENVPGKKNAESVEEFYGQWKQTKFVLLGEDYDVSEYNEGALIGENTYYITVNGEKSPDYIYPETAELTIRDGVLKINSDGHWTTYVLTEDGSIVLCGSSMLTYLVRADQ